MGELSWSLCEVIDDDKSRFRDSNSVIERRDDGDGDYSLSNARPRCWSEEGGGRGWGWHFHALIRVPTFKQKWIELKSPKAHGICELLWWLKIRGSQITINYSVEFLGKHIHAIGLLENYCLEARTSNKWGGDQIVDQRHNDATDDHDPGINMITSTRYTYLLYAGATMSPGTQTSYVWRYRAKWIRMPFQHRKHLKCHHAACLFPSFICFVTLWPCRIVKRKWPPRAKSVCRMIRKEPSSLTWVRLFSFARNICS